MDVDDPVEAFMSIPSIEQSIVSPNGDKIAFFWNKYGSMEIFIYDVRQGESARISSDTVPPHKHRAAQLLQWHPEGSELFIHKPDDQGNANIYLADTTGETTSVTTRDDVTLLWDVGPDGEFIYYWASESLIRQSLSTGETKTIVDDVGWKVQWFAGLDPQGDKIVYGGSVHGDTHSLYIADTDGSAECKLDINTAGEVIARAWHPSGDKLLIVDSPWGGSWGVYTIDTSEMDWRSSDDEELPITYLNGGNQILVSRRTRVTTAPFVYSEGDRQQIDLEGTARFSKPVSTGTRINDESVIIPRESVVRPRDLLGYSVASDEITDLFQSGYGTIDPSVLVEPESVTIETPSGNEIEGSLYDSRVRPSPGIVQLYGAQSEWAPWFRRHVHFLTYMGYTVFQPIHDGDPFTDQEHETHAEAGRWLRQQEWIDETRVGALGHSHGGYDVYMQLVLYPDLWTSGVAMSGVTDLIAQFGTGDDAAFITSVLGELDTNIDAWQDQSPITHLNNFQDPLLLLHPENDYVSIEQVKQFRDALVEAGFKPGTDFVYQKIPDQGHVPETIDERIRRWEYVAEFLEMHL